MSDDCPEWVQQRLKEWARWALGSISGGLGYPTASITESFRVDRSRGVGGSPDSALAAAVVDRCVRRLPERLSVVLRAHYLARGTIEDRAKSIGLTRQTYYVLLPAATATVAVLIEEEESRKQPS